MKRPIEFSTLKRVYLRVPLLQNNILTLDKDYMHYLKIVLRFKVGTTFRVFNREDGEYLAEIYDIQNKFMKIKILNLLRTFELQSELILGISIIKPDKMLYAINMATQLGVTKIIPLVAERCQLQSINIEKFEKCIIEATEQSERLNPPVLKDVMSLGEYNNILGQEGIIIYANEMELKENSIKKIRTFPSRVSIIIGPEGGFTEQEVKRFLSWNNAYSVSLGCNILRTETAVAVGLAQINLMRDSA